jgi:ketosteroid isomerase-like protein
MFPSKRAFLGCLVVFGLLVSTPALAADVDDLKATYEKAVTAYNSHDDAFFGSVHDACVYYAPYSPFAIKGKAAYQKSIKTIWAAMESSTFRAINPQFLVSGSTGVVWGHYALAVKLKDGPMTSTFGRFTVTCAKSDGKWLVVSSHYSAIPSGN